jgi:hypothetical protein
MSTQLPEVRITTSFLTATSCAVCGRHCPMLDIPVPTAYTVASISADLPPIPVCDDCIETRYPAETWDELRAERRRFERS